MEQVTGIEPATSAWKAEILPLNYTCILVRITGLEPAHLTIQEPKSCVSANSTISAYSDRERV